MSLAKTLARSVALALSARNWTKFTAPTARRGSTAYPKSPAHQLAFGIRWDYDGEVIRPDARVYHKFQLQPNAGKVPPSVKKWRDAHGSTHAVMASAYVLKGGTKHDVETALREATAAVRA